MYKTCLLILMGQPNLLKKNRKRQKLEKNLCSRSNFFIFCFILLFSVLWYVVSLYGIKKSAKEKKLADHFTTLPSKGLKVSRFDGYFLIFILNSFQLCAENCEEAAVIMQELEHLIHTNKSNIVWVMYQQGKMFQRFRERRFRERKREREREREKIQDNGGEIRRQQIGHCF